MRSPDCHGGKITKALPEGSRRRNWPSSGAVGGNFTAAFIRLKIAISGTRMATSLTDVPRPFLHISIIYNGLCVFFALTCSH
jgi:hypothetical protein